MQSECDEDNYLNKLEREMKDSTLPADNRSGHEDKTDNDMKHDVTKNDDTWQDRRQTNKTANFSIYGDKEPNDHFVVERDQRSKHSENNTNTVNVLENQVKKVKQGHEHTGNRTSSNHNDVSTKKVRETYPKTYDRNDKREHMQAEKKQEHKPSANSDKLFDKVADNYKHQEQLYRKDKSKASDLSEIKEPEKKQKHEEKSPLKQRESTHERGDRDVDKDQDHTHSDRDEDRDQAHIFNLIDPDQLSKQLEAANLDDTQTEVLLHNAKLLNSQLRKILRHQQLGEDSTPPQGKSASVGGPTRRPRTGGKLFHPATSGRWSVSPQKISGHSSTAGSRVGSGKERTTLPALKEKGKMGNKLKVSREKNGPTHPTSAKSRLGSSRGVTRPDWDDRFIFN